ncbi:MAG: hypothetical protein HC803_03395 [Saprospiraceae bacterium]|nr:hypothetical protein [Saprospiraceae bacterium]
MNKLFLSIGLLLASFSVINAQNYIGTALPSATFGAGTLQTNQLQLEAEFRGHNFLSLQPSLNLPIGLLRYGIKENWEVYTLVVDNLSINTATSENDISLTDWRIGSKYNSYQRTKSCYPLMLIQVFYLEMIAYTRLLRQQLLS